MIHDDVIGQMLFDIGSHVQMGNTKICNIHQLICL